MSLYTDASIIITPNAFKESKLYSIKPGDGSGDMTVVRATTATRVNEQGFIEVVPRNLLQRSEQFDNAYWTKLSSSVISNATTSPNGSLSADKLIEGVGAGLKYIQIAGVTFTSSDTISLYAKSAERTQIGIGNSAVGHSIFDLSNGTIVSSSSASINNETIESVGDGWYRITANVIIAGAFGFQIFLANSGTISYTGDGTSGVFIWGAQLEQGSTATEYFPTTTRLNIPRIDYTNGSCPSILVEPQRTNIILNSQNFAAASWGANATTITENAGISPDGNNNANKFIPNTSATSHFISQVINSSSNGSISIYAKADGYNNITLLTSNTNVNYNLSSGTVQAVGGVGTGAIQSVGNGWYRCILYKVLANESLYISCGSNTNAGFFNGSGNGTSGVLIWGSQVEVGTYATSYIPTVASAVTRNADVISKTGISGLIGQTEGTLFVDVIPVVNAPADIVALNLSTNNSISIGMNSTTIRATIFNSGNLFGITGGDYIKENRYKIALVYKNNNSKFFVNGVLKNTNISNLVFNGALNDLFNYSTNYYEGESALNYNSTQLYKTALTDEECILLTGDTYNSYSEMATNLNYILQ